MSKFGRFGDYPKESLLSAEAPLLTAFRLRLFPQLAAPKTVAEIERQAHHQPDDEPPFGYGRLDFHQPAA